MEQDIQKQFNLPLYTRNKSFADASKSIQSKFKGREDAESKNTEKDLLDRLRQAQEFVKAQEQAKQKAIADAKAMKEGDAVVDNMGQVINRNDPRVQNGSLQPNQPPQPPDVSQDQNAQAAMQQLDQQVSQQQPQGLMGQIQQAMGGKMNKCAEGGTLDKYGNVIGDSVGALGVLGGLGTKAFGRTGIDTSGATATTKDSLTGDTASGAIQGGLSGAKLGNDILPGGIGAAIGGGIGVLTGGTLGLLGGVNQNKDAQKSQVNNTFARASQYNNQFDKGGPINPNYRAIQDIIGVTPDSSFGPASNKALSNWQTSQGLDATGLGPKTYGAMGLSPTGQMQEVNSVIPKGIDTLKSGLDPTTYGMRTRALSNVNNIGEKLMPTTGYKQKDTDKTFNPLTLAEGLRYAPAAMNLYQLATLKKPRPEATDRLTTRYKPQFTDENAIMNAAREETNSQREAIRQTSGGSASEARANLLATQLGSMKGLSSASQTAREQNLAEKRQAQSFNLGVDQANLSQANLQRNIEAQKSGRYDSMKSQLLASLGDTAGAIGKEELYKKFPEMMGLNYNWRGKYEPPTDEEMKTLQAIRDKEKKKKTYTKTGTTETE